MHPSPHGPELYRLARDAEMRGALSDAVSLYEASWHACKHAATAFRMAMCLLAYSSATDARIDVWFLRALELNANNQQYAYEYAKYLHAVGRERDAQRVIAPLLTMPYPYAPAVRFSASLRSSPQDGLPDTT